MDESTQKAVEKIEKLLRLAAKAGTEAEAASATAKAQELLAVYNLDMAVIESHADKATVSGKRLDEQVAGGMYAYQRRLWRNIANLNFCMYWSMVVKVREGSRQAKRGRKTTHEHRLVGRQINVIATRNMASYLNGTIERLCRERLQEEGGQFYSAWAVAYREGMSDRIVDKVQERRATLLDEEDRKLKAAVRKASRAGTSIGSTLTVAGLEEREEQANYDFLNGAGAWQRKKEREEEAERDWDKHRAAQAKAQAEAEAEYAKWAEANPEQARREDAKARSRARAADRRASRRSYSYRSSFRQTKESMRRNSGGYHAGWDAAEKVAIDPQVDEDKRRLR